MSVNTGRVLNDKSTDPNYGLALDHAILLLNPKSKYLATIRFWRNPCSVILGRGQTLNEEVNQTFCREHKIPIARRITGGGTVYHDEGNINISLFIPKSALEKPNDVKRTASLFTNLLKESIEMTGIKEIHVDESNNLLYQDHKVSGAAAYFTRETILHHSTLLLSADLEKLEGSLIHNVEPRRGRSRYKPTTNLIGLQTENWKKIYVKLLGEKFKLNFLPGNLTLEESALATKLRNTIYINPNWINNGERPIDQMSIN